MNNSRLSGSEILDRIIRYNETNDWSVFDDVPPSQHSCVLYPFVFDKDLLHMKRRRDELKRKEEANKLYGPIT